MSLMSNLFNQGAPNPFSNMMGMMQKFQQFMTNPFASLMGMNPNLNIPQNLSNNPKGMVEHLIKSGQMSQDQFNQLSQTANQFQNMFPKF